MVDFKKALANLRAEREKDPAWRARYEAEAKLDESRRPIRACFETLGLENGKSIVLRSEEREIHLRREPGAAYNGADVVRFFGGPTGHEAYIVDDFFMRLALTEKWGKDRFSICAGTPNSWDACSVSNADFVAYLKEHFKETHDRVAAALTKEDPTLDTAGAARMTASPRP